MLNLNSLLNPELPVSALFSSLTSLTSSALWSEWFEPTTAANFVTDLTNCLNAVKLIGQSGSAFAGRDHSGEAFEEAFEGVEDEIAAIEEWTSFRSAEPAAARGPTEAEMGALIDALNISVGYLADTAHIHRNRLQLPLTFAQVKRAEETRESLLAQRTPSPEDKHPQASLSQTTGERATRLTELEETFRELSRDEQGQFALWVSPSGEQNGRELLSQIAHAIDEIKTRDLANSGREPNNEAFNALVNDIENATMAIESWDAHGKGVTGIGTNVQTSTRNLTLKQKINVILGRAKRLAKLVGITRSEWRNTGLPQLLKEYPDRAERQARSAARNAANGLGHSAARWGAMSERRANIYGILRD